MVINNFLDWEVVVLLFKADFFFFFNESVILYIL